MDVTTALLVAVGAAVGAPLRYLADLAVQSLHETAMPWGTFVVNVAGSFVLGAVASGVTSGEVPAGVLTAVGTGFCGALTTFSTFGYETVRLMREGAPLAAAGNVMLSLAAGFAACVAGWQVVAVLA